MDVNHEKFHHIIIYYTGHGFGLEQGHQKGHWVCRDNEGISLKEIYDLFLEFLKQNEKSLTIISDCCYSGQWIKDVKCLGINPTNLVIISACTDSEVARTKVLSDAFVSHSITSNI